ncbi:related to RING-like zinc finger protein ZIN [Cephalotrichum gorgonifer]|uniref:Related to RING-like zinc finger protein ZIN n=1 Tax=Cephalotrichum gorgonifer TaxID=2041049 RepID=A0AAE8MTQ5_9PEZI|nr:related to RING-like zinc finger protein ZIN [Cephalotrichum gorgonifer]
MVFSTLLGDRAHTPKIKTPRASRATTAKTTTPNSTEDVIPPDYIHDESQLGDVPEEAPDLRELNNSLVALAAVFPNVQVEVFREMLASFDGESRLALVADTLLKNRITWVKGRWRVTDRGTGGEGEGDGDGEANRDDDGQTATPPGTTSLVPRAETFRSEEYKKAVRTLAWHEFKGLSRSTINAVLAESNHSYLDSRPTLAALSEKSWRFTISSIFLRRKSVAAPAEAENHPLVVWKSTGKGSIVPTVKRTGNAELDAELFGVLVRPLRERARREQEVKDKELAQYLNNEEAAELDSTHECCCCFTDGAFEEFASCTTEGHLLCFRCVQHSLSEAVFGQGWRSSVDEVAGALRCMAVEGTGCDGRIDPDHLRHAMLDSPGGADVLRGFDRRLAEQALLAAGVPLVRCPFCDYAEVDDLYLSPEESRLRLRVGNLINILFLLICIGTIPFVLPTILLSTLVCLCLNTRRAALGPYLAAEWHHALQRHRRRRRGNKFTCLGPRCGRSSCLSCHKPWSDIHVCNESSLVSLRTRVEQAMSAAVKRVCPRCGTSFVKSSGCNKLQCPCGYKMCYVCRADIGSEGYRHFCEHFRPEGDARACTECRRCNLWEGEDTEALLREAREEAEREWEEEEKRELSGAERAFLETGVGGGGQGGGGGWAKKKNGGWRAPSVPETMDALVESLFC